MPVSGKEESAVKPVARQPSFDISGVPIKKRRFFRHPSPPPEEQPSSVSPKNGPLQNEPVSSTYGSAPLNPKLVGSASGLSDTRKKIPDKVIPTSVINYSLVKTETSGHEVMSDSSAPLGMESKPVEDEARGKVYVSPATNELKSAPAASNSGEFIIEKQVPTGKSKPGVTAGSGNLELSLGLKEHRVAAERCSTDGSGHKHGNKESISLNISSSKAGSHNQFKTNDMKLTSDGGSKSADRLNWDLNTTMDAWEGPLDDKAAGKITGNEFKTAGARPDIKPMICPPIAISTVVSDAENVQEKSLKLLNSSGTVPQSATLHNLDSSLHLQLSPSFVSFRVSEEPSSSVSNKDPCKVFPNASSPKGLSSTGKSDISKPKNVKQEPLDEGTRSILHIPTSLVNRQTVKRELMEKFAQEVLRLGNYSSLKIIGPRSIKAESCQEGNREMPKAVEGMCQQSGIEETSRTDEEITQLSGELPEKNEIETLSKKPGAAEDLKTADRLSQQSCNTEALNGLEGESPQFGNTHIPEVVEGTPKQSDQVLVKLHESKGVDRTMEQFDKLEGAQDCSGMLDDILKQSEKQESLGSQPEKLEVIVEQSDNKESVSLEVKEQTGCSINTQASHNQDTQPDKNMGLASESAASYLQLEHARNTNEVHPNNDLALGESATVKHVISEPAFVLELNVPGASTAPIISDQNVDIPKECELKCMDDISTQQLHRNVNGSVSDEEKINLSGDMLEEDSYEYESDGNSVPMDIEEDGVGHNDYEDGEVQDQQLQTATEGSTTNIAQDIGSVDLYANQANYMRNCMNVHLTSSTVEEKGKHQEGSIERSDDIAKESLVSQVDGGATVITGRHDSMEPSLAHLQAVGYDKHSPSMMMQRGPHDAPGKKDGPEGQSAEQSAVTLSGHETLSLVTQVSEESSQTASFEKSGSALLNVEVPLTSDDVAKDINNAINNQSRIINLPKASNMASPDKTRSNSGKSFQSRPGRERLQDMSLEGDRFHPRGRDEAYIYDGSQWFSRERRQDHHYYRNNRLNFNRGRGRLPSRSNNLHGDRDPERDFPSDFYGGHSDFVPRHKGDTEFMKNIGPDGNFNNGRGGRKIVDNETSVFCHLPSRRHSPGERGIQMMHRVPRNIGEESSEVGLRHSDKIVRGGYSEDYDDIEHTFTRPQPPYEGVGGHFVQGHRNFSPMQRRGPQIRTKSPIRSRSPGPWSSSRRRSPGGFGGPTELSGRMSPPIYRIDRIRSPDRSSGFPVEMGVRRHGGSPPYLLRPNDTREIDPGRNRRVHPRSRMSSNRSPNGWDLLRNSRRFGPVDHQEREGSDEFFGGGPMQSDGRFHHDLGAADGDGEDRRRFSERRGPIRPFRSSFNGAEGENFHLNSEDGPSKPFRLFSQDDPAVHERGNLRNRELDRSMKNRPENAPRRVRGMEEQEGNYRHGGHVLYDDGFDDMTRVKRKRFD